ncbi:MAG: lysophospholipid acyltransferase family protein [Candidatus Omnitrophota bacterium]
MAKKKPRRYFIFLLFRILSLVLYILPMRLGLAIGKTLGAFTFYILRKERLIALYNLKAAFGDTEDSSRIKIIARRVFENLGKNFVEVISLPKFDKNNIDRYVRCKGLETITRLIQEGRGGIVLTAHFGNWELLAHYFAIKGYRVNVIARRVRMEYFGKFLDAVRKKNGVNILYRDASAKDVLKLLKNNEFVGIMPDQDMDSVSGVFVDFFGRPAYTPNGPALLSLLTGVPVIPCFMVRHAFGHEVVIEKPLEFAATGDRDKDITENTQVYTRVIEGYIKEYPEQWVWFHERWKTCPTV